MGETNYSVATGFDFRFTEALAQEDGRRKLVVLYYDAAIPQLRF